MWLNRYNKFLYGQHFGNVDIEQYDGGEDRFFELYFSVIDYSLQVYKLRSSSYTRQPTN